jgi:hypothetical protein
MQLLDLDFVIRVVKMGFVGQGDYDKNMAQNLHLSGIRKCINENASARDAASAKIATTQS